MSIEKIRCLIPDLIGFGRSDKPKRDAIHEWSWHRDVVLEWLNTLEVKPMSLACARSAEPLMELLMAEMPDLVDRDAIVVVPDERTGTAVNAWKAPFPVRGHEAALRALGPVDEISSGPSPEQAREVASDIASRAAGTMGYCRP